MGFILNCDDHDAGRYVVTQLLKRAGYEVREAATGREALQLAELGPSLIVLDVNLPDMTGIDVCRRLKANPATAQIPVLQTSATFVSSDWQVQGLESGADGYLTQPIEAPVLTATVRALLRARELEDVQRQRAEELAAADRQKDEFLAMLAHELRNPLNAIATANSLQDRVGAQDPQNRRLRAMVTRQLHHLARLVDDLLEVSRITRGQIQLLTETIDLRTALRQAVQSTLPQLESKHQQCSVELPPEPIYVRGDLLRLEQVLVNVIGNASKYSPADGRVAVTCAATEGGAEIRIKDDGHGIPAEQIDRIFDLFAQVDQSLARSVGGLGIGLTIARRLVELHGGRITAHSDGVGRGAEFVITLPVAAAGPQPPAELPGGDYADAPSLDVLLIEDNPDTRDLMGSLVESWGHRVTAVADGTAGLAAARTMRPAVALIDVGLPGIDGYQVAQNLRSSEVGRGMLLVAMTGYGRPEDRARALESGFDVHLVKPVQPEQLQAILAAPLAAARRHEAVGR